MAHAGLGVAKTRPDRGASSTPRRLPASARIDEQLARLDKEINQAANRIVRGLESDAAAATTRESTLRAQLAQLQERQTVDAQANAVALGLQRSADAKRAIYNDLSRNAQEQAQEARIGDVRAWTVSAAQAPSFPKTSVCLLFGLVIGSAAVAGAIRVAEARERGFRSAEEVEDALNVPFLAAVPELPSKRPEPTARLTRPCSVNAVRSLA